MSKQSLLVRVFNQPSTILALKAKEWELLVNQARASSLLARLSFVLREQQLFDNIPEPVRWHFTSSEKMAEAHRRDTLDEVERIRTALSITGIRPIFLKGAGYILANDNARQGRIFSDIDIFVPKRDLDKVVQALCWQGWNYEELDPYDEAYYHRWMHEVPPLIHEGRGTSVDVHHNLLPLTSRYAFDAELIHQNLTAETDTLPPVDRVLHSAAHLFLSGEFEHGLRDLSDLHLMLTQFGQAHEDFWKELPARATTTGLSRVLYYCLDHCRRVFATEIPETCMAAVAPSAPGPIAKRLMTFCLTRGLQPNHPSAHGRCHNLALLLLFVRSHWLKMPLPLLCRHLAHKAFISPLRAKQSANQA